MLSSNLNLISGKPRLRYSPTDYPDIVIAAVSGRIESDYLYILKSVIAPELTKSNSLKLRELRLLASIGFYDRPVTVSYISEKLRFESATVSRASLLLEKEGFITRTDNPADSRSVILELTELGEQLATKYMETVSYLYNKLETAADTSLSNEEKLQFLNILVKINTRSTAMRDLCEQELKRNRK